MSTAGSSTAPGDTPEIVQLGLLADLFGVVVAIAAIGFLTFASGLIVLMQMHERLHSRRPLLTEGG